MEAPPPPPSSASAAVPAQDLDSPGLLASPKHIPEVDRVSCQRPAPVVRRISAPDDSSAVSVEVPLSHSLPRLTAKTTLPADKTVYAVYCCLMNIFCHLQTTMLNSFFSQSKLDCS